MASPADVTDNQALSRFELIENGFTAFATYRRDGDTVAIRHVEAPAELRGKGTANRLMQGVVDRLRGENVRIAPQCSYAAAWFRRHPEYGALLA